MPEYQGKGVGKELIQRAFDWLGDDKDVTVFVASYNIPSIEFYKKVGFKEDKTLRPEDESILPSGKIIPVIGMVRKIN